MNIRPAVRALMLDQHDHVLLVRFEFPTGTRWALPGGGIEPGEDPITALRREIHEEVGLTQFDIGDHIWSRLHVIPIIGTDFDGQRDRVHLVRTHRFDPVPTIGWDQMNAERVFEMRWWSVDEIVASDEHFAPRRLGELVRDLLTIGAPERPVETGV